ncbi:MAG: dicarboxylate/amino acid:cation symporter [Pseudomonadota bacterium]|nr:dicarboxylate/amino acid:cation symporter [Pseudomonadota bacterium]
MRLSLNQQILWATLLGVAVGMGLQWLGTGHAITQPSLYVADTIGKLFIGLLKMVLMPLIFCSIVVGVANLRQHQQIHRVWQATLGMFLFTMALAVVVALTAMNVFQVGLGLNVHLFSDAMAAFEAKQLPFSEFASNFLTGLLMNPVTAMAEGKILPAVVFALFMGIALVSGGARYQQVIDLFEQFLALMMQIVQWIMWVAPLGIFALLVKLTATQSVDLLTTMGAFMLLVILTTLFHGVVVLPSILYALTRISPRRFWRASRPALMTAFATSSSAATLPVTLRCTQNLGVRPQVAGFVLPLGATMNMDGTALYEAAAALFVANLMGIELSLGQQLLVFFVAMVTSVGSPGIPSAGMVSMVMVLQAVGLPAEAIAILLPMDRLLDTVRTAVNVEGDMVTSCVVNRLGGTSQQAEI